MRLMVVSWLPVEPVDSGYKRRVRALYGAASELCEVIVTGPGAAPDDIPWVPLPLETEPGDRHALSSRSCMLRALSRAFADAVVKTAMSERPDFIVAEGLWAAPACRKAARRLGVDWGITINNLESRSAAGIYPPPIPWFLWLYEKSAYRKADRLFIVSETDARLLQRALTPSPPRVTIVPNGTEPARMVTEAEVAAQRSEWRIREDEKVVLFVGKLDYRPNRRGLEWFSRKVYPKVGELPFKLRWIAAGLPRPESEIPPFEFVGYVDDLDLALATADVCIAPVLHGSGTSIKVLDYLGAGCPVVATPHAVRGLPIEPDVHLFATTEAEEFARCLRVVLLDENLATRMGEQAQALIRGRLNWKNIAIKMVTDISRSLGMMNQPPDRTVGTPDPPA